jgi:hypothetical protein
MQKKFPPSHRLVIHDVAMRVLADVGVHQPSLIFRDLAERVLDLDLAVARGLNFGTGQNQACFKSVGEVVFVASGPVFGQDFNVIAFRIHFWYPRVEPSLRQSLV